MSFVSRVSSILTLRDYFDIFTNFSALAIGVLSVCVMSLLRISPDIVDYILSS